jgi:DNA-binding transcriptional ArsR family regulator
MRLTIDAGGRPRFVYHRSVLDRPDIASIAALIGDPSRGRMLTALMDGRALTATELALEAGVVPSTASSHLARMTKEGLIAIARQGRHRYFRIASEDVAAMLETLMGLASNRGDSRLRTGPRDERLRRARVCYDHLAGEAAIELLAGLRRRRFLRESSGELTLTRLGESWLHSALGIEVAELRRLRRPLCRPCLDWSERRTHLAGAAGAAIFERLVALRWIRREPDTRAVTFSPRGHSFLAGLQTS